jgi:hypothetical protein
MRKILLCLSFLSMNFIHAQLIVNNTTQTPAQLVQSVLLGNGLTVSNIKFNGSAAAAATVRDQVGKFTNGNTSNIGLNSGIVLATNKATVAIGPNNQGGANQASAFPLSPGDADLEMLTTGVVKNKAILEFDFVPTGQNLSFNFVFASEEYLEFVSTDYNDVFGFFISGPGITGPYSGNAKNIALIPTTTTAITIDNVNNVSNPTFYINNGTGATPLVNTTIQYDGFTKVIAAIANVQCGQTYHIKLAIANVGDNSWDSAVFLEANSFNTTPVFSLPPDLTVTSGTAPCFGAAKQICTGLATTILHEWTLNGVPIVGASGPCVTISEPGQLCATVYPLGSACPTTRCMTVQFLQPMPISNPVTVKACAGSTFNLTTNTAVILDGLNAADYDVAYYHTQLDAENTSNPIIDISAYSGVEGEIIWAGVSDIASGSGCVETKSFILTFVSAIAPEITCGTPTNSSVAFNWTALAETTDYTVSYQINTNTPINIGAIGNVITYPISGLTPGNNVQITLTPVGGVGTCFAPATFTCSTTLCPSITLPSTDQTLCLNGNPTPFSVTTSATASNSISYVYFTTLQVGDTMYTGGIPLGNVTPTAGGIATLDLPVLGSGSLPNAAGTYYVYAIVTPAPLDVTCRPYSLIQVVVNDVPLAPTVVTPVTYCQNATASALTATGTNLLWYTAATGGVGSASAPTPSTAAAGNIDYYVSQTILGCESPRASITVTVNATPAAPTVTTPVTYCQNASASALTATGTSLLWYTTAAGGVGSATAPTPSTATAGNINTYVSDTILGCEGPRATITVTVNATPVAPTVTPVSYCQNAPASALTATGSGLLWYTAAIGGTGSRPNDHRSNFLPSMR